MLLLAMPVRRTTSDRAIGADGIFLAGAQHPVSSNYATNLSGRFFASIARTNLSHFAIPARFSRM